MNSGVHLVVRDCGSQKLGLAKTKRRCSWRSRLTQTIGAISDVHECQSISAGCSESSRTRTMRAYTLAITACCMQPVY